MLGRIAVKKEAARERERERERKERCLAYPYLPGLISMFPPTTLPSRSGTIDPYLRVILANMFLLRNPLRNPVVFGVENFVGIHRKIELTL